MKYRRYIPLFAAFANRFFIIPFVLFCIFPGCATKPPHESGNFKQTDLVELIKLDQGIKLDIRYATTNNIAGRPVYTEARAFLQKPAALALVKVNEELKALGYGLLVFDGYRPWSVTKIFWDMTSTENKKFVADPKKGSKHNRGCAVDLSLYDLATGKEIEMTGVYDEMSERSYPYYTGGTDAQRKNERFAENPDGSQWVKVYEFEWWHFDYQDWQSFRITNVPFSAIK